jgi:pimeloyl-ACP methyl ester carboxylesterase
MATLLTSDGVRIHATHLTRTPASDGSGSGAGDDLALVVAHGFTGSLRRPTLQAVLTAFREHAGVVAFDFRGHGRSGGVTTVGNREIDDLEAAVRWARSLGYQRIATIGFSMGGAVVIRHAGLIGGVDAVVSVSAPAWWHYRGTLPMQRLHWLIETGSGRALSRVWRRTRIDRAGWPDLPVPPYEAAASIAPIPLLVVHGDADPFFPVDHAIALDAAANEPKELWIRPGLGHAEGATDPALVAALAAWVRGHVGAVVEDGA